jgi:methionine synthase I (cobalamin-dependent)
MQVPLKLPMLLDGATGTNLFKAGMPNGVCVEKWILENSDAMKNIQSQFVANGSDAIYAPTFSANSARLAHHKLKDKVSEYNKELVAISKSVAGNALVAGDMSPTGLFIEPFGDSSFLEIVEIYKEQASALFEAGVDFFIAETIMSLTDVRACVIACKEFNLPIFVTMTVDEHGKTLSGSSALSCLISLQALGVTAFGLNCSYGPEKMAEIIKEIAPFANVPLIAKPNAGMPNIENQNEYDLTPVQMGKAMENLFKAGATIVGGCCGTSPEHLLEIKRAMDSFDFSSVEIKKDTHEVVLANETEVFLLGDGSIEYTATIECSPDMADDLVDIEKSSSEVLLIKINSTDEALMFSENMHMVKLPVSFLCADEETLELSLTVFNGRAIVDSKCDIKREDLERICAKYGAYLY